MLQGLYSSAAGMIGLESRQDVIANNIANASTPGFKRQEPVDEGFAVVFSKVRHRNNWFMAQRGPGGGPRVNETATDFTAGMLTRTDNPLHVGVEGPGYIAIDTPRGERYTRSGQFTVDRDGHLSTLDGNKVQSLSGDPIDVRGGRVEIADNGTVKVDALPAGQIRMVEFADARALEREGDSLYRGTDRAQVQDPAATRLHAENLEASNVNVPSEMLKLMLGARAYEANSRLVQAVDESMGRLIDRVAMPS